MSSKNCAPCRLQYRGYKYNSTPLSNCGVKVELLPPHEKRMRSQQPTPQSDWRQAAVTTRSFFHIIYMRFWQTWRQWISIHSDLMILVEIASTSYLSTRGKFWATVYLKLQYRLLLNVHVQPFHSSSLSLWVQVPERHPAHARQPLGTHSPVEDWVAPRHLAPVAPRLPGSCQDLAREQNYPTLRLSNRKRVACVSGTAENWGE